MEIAFALGAVALWGITALLVRGLERLEKPAGGRP